MPETVAWDDDGTPRSPRFDAIRHSAAGGLAQARHVFLHGCGLPQAWAGRRQWRILETRFGLGLNFLATWRAWQRDPQRPRMLHFASLETWPVAATDLLRSAASEPELAPLAAQLAQRWQGLAPGLHRFVIEQGRVLLTLGIGDAPALLRQLDFTADAVFLDGFDPEHNPQMWELGTLKAVSRLCRQGTALATWSVAGQLRRDLGTCGFQPERVAGLPPKREALRARYAPAWPVKGLRGDHQRAPDRCVVIGAGLAGAAVAASLATRGWQVEVLDAAAQPAAGASALPVGLLAPHQSPDDNLLSRLSRTGVRITLQACADWLEAGEWAPTGALEVRGDDARTLPSVPELAPWTREATAQQKQAAGLPAGQPAWWHQNAAWVRPAALVRAWLAQPGIVFRGGCKVGSLEPVDGGWQALDAQGQVLAQAPLVIVAAAHSSGPLLSGRIATHPVRGQVSWDLHQPAALPPFPVHGHGHFLPRVPTAQGPAWFAGSSYGRGETDAAPRPAEQQANLQRLRDLLPEVAAAVADRFAGGQVRAWAGVRCSSPDRRPLAGEVRPGLWVSTAMGSRGLTFAALCGELIAARLHGEPLPLEKRLAKALDAGRSRDGG